MKSALLFMSIMGALFMGNAFANQHSNTNHLIERIQILESRLAVLEARFSFATFMPDFAEQFHVMHRASESGDWAVAAHELQEMKHLIDLAPTIDAEKGHLFQAMMGPVMEKMENAIAHANKKKMAGLLSETVQICNSCHMATGSEFIHVVLDATETLSMRHPHTFKKQKMASHKHE